jgi:hypothetical protein
VHEGHEPAPLTDLRDADVLAGEGMTEIYFTAFEADPATSGDGDGVVVKGVGELLKARGAGGT